MTREESAKLATMVVAAYPGYYGRFDKLMLDAMHSAWHGVLEDCGYEDAKAGLKAYMSGDDGGFPPSPGQVMARIPVPPLPDIAERYRLEDARGGYAPPPEKLLRRLRGLTGGAA